MGQTIASVALLLMSVVACGLVVRRCRQWSGRGAAVGHSLQHLGTVALTPSCSVALVQVGRETLVLGLTSQSVTLLTTLVQRAATDASRDPYTPARACQHCIQVGNGKGLSEEGADRFLPLERTI
ncbi:MAG: flagellar biosynthetic protein FliO [Candidatus Binatia bacterium]|nr:flagellar biosynthetic protein FliO [Candidatus Binatia bacterium]